MATKRQAHIGDWVPTPLGEWYLLGRTAVVTSTSFAKVLAEGKFLTGAPAVSARASFHVAPTLRCFSALPSLPPSLPTDVIFPPFDYLQKLQ